MEPNRLQPVGKSALGRAGISSTAERLLLFSGMFSVLLAFHWPLLHLPYFWDEAGYYVPAARDLWLTGRLIPHTVPSNAHPPLVMMLLALAWKLFGYSIAVSRTAMLALASFSLLGLFLLARRVANAEVAWATAALTAAYPVFFVQSSLAQVDLAAAGLTFWGLLAYIEDRRVAMFVWFALACLTKETAVLGPLAILGWEVVGPVLLKSGANRWILFEERNWSRILAVGGSVVPLALWFFYHYHATGVVFGNPEFFRYNVQATANPIRILFALLGRLWQTFGHMHLYALTLLGAAAMMLDPLKDRPTERPRIAIPIQMVFAVVILAYVVALAIIGGALLSRYLLPAVPLAILINVSTIWRRMRESRFVLLGVLIFFMLGWAWKPPYSFPFEDNLSYRDYIQLHQAAATYLEVNHPQARVLTAWTASDEITRPWLGYVSKPLRVVRIENFSAEQMLSATDASREYDFALVFSTKYEPAINLGNRPFWLNLKKRFFDYHQDLPPQLCARILGGRIIFEQRRGPQWIAVIEVQKPAEARNASGQEWGRLVLSGRNSYISQFGVALE